MPEIPRLLITGGTGFVGRHLLAVLAERGRRVVILTRTARPAPPGVAEVRPVGDLASGTAPADALAGAEVLLHLAGHVAVKGGGAIEESANVRMARAVAERARAAGIPRVIVLSSIAASVAERTPHLARRYGLEKLAADAVFREVVPGDRLLIVRPPAVYGTGMIGPLAKLGRIVARGLPLPLGAARAARSYISAGNLARLLDTIAMAPDAAWAEGAGRVYEPSDGAPVPTDELVRMIGQALGRPVRLVPVPVMALRLLGRLTGRSELISGAVDPVLAAGNEPLTRIFGWTPAERMPESLAFLRAPPA